MSIFTRCNNINLALISLLLSPALLQAEEREERWYQVEIIIFSQNNPEYHDSELWPLDYTLPNLEVARELIRPDLPDASAPMPLLPQPFSLIADENLQLDATAQRIRRATDLDLVLHLGWLQPGLPADQAIAVHIYEGMTEKDNELKQKKVPGLNETETEQVPLKLDGSLRLILSRYLHLETDLIWRKPLPAEQLSFIDEMQLFGDDPEAPVSNEEESAAVITEEKSDEAQDEAAMTEETLATTSSPGFQVFRLQQSRRMRSREIHYLDHPLFGIVALVTPYEIAQPELETTEAPAQ